MGAKDFRQGWGARRLMELESGDGTGLVWVGVVGYDVLVFSFGFSCVVCEEPGGKKGTSGGGRE